MRYVKQVIFAYTSVVYISNSLNVDISVTLVSLSVEAELSTTLYEAPTKKAQEQRHQNIQG